MNKVIFVGGTPYCGSTLLDMILSSANGGLSCGEVHALVHPFRPHHINPVCGCGARNCEFWRTSSIKTKRVHVELFKKAPECQFHVDSSKSIPWMLDQAQALNDAGIETQNVLIWKTPEQFYRSCLKRNEVSGWFRRWSNYHRQYFSSMPSWVSIRYDELVGSRVALEVLCSRIGIDYSDDMVRYWEKKHHTLFGNSSAKIHLYAQESFNFNRLQTELRSLSDDASTSIVHSRHRSIYTDESDDVRPMLSSSERRLTEEILSVLTESDIQAGGNSGISLPPTHPCFDRMVPVRFCYQRLRRLARKAQILVRASNSM